MIPHTNINARSFICCVAFQSPNETITYFNDQIGHYHQSIYMISGDMDTFPSDTPELLPNAKNYPLKAGNFYDISHTKGKYIISKTYLEGASFAMFNPIPTDRILRIEILRDKQTKEISTTNKRTTIVCLTGPVEANGKKINSMQFATVFENKKALLTMETNTICALVHEL